MTATTALDELPVKATEGARVLGLDGLPTCATIPAPGPNLSATIDGNPTNVGAPAPEAVPAVYVIPIPATAWDQPRLFEVAP